MIDKDEEGKYFGFEIDIPPQSDTFKNACLRAPDLIFKTSLQTEHDERWVVLWRSYENDLSERGLVLKNGEEIEQNNCLSFLPLSVVLFRLAEEPDLRRVCARFFSIVPRSVSRKSNCDLPPLNLRLLKDTLSVNGHGMELHVWTPRQFKSFYRLRTLDPVPAWSVRATIIEEFAWILFRRASTVLSLIQHESAFQCLLPVFTETINYGGLLLGFFEEKNGRVSKEVEMARKRFGDLMHQEWYVGSRHQRRFYPSGLMQEWGEDRERYVLYDFQPGRRLRYTESEGKGYVTECADERDALPFEASKRRHILPKNASRVLVYSPTRDWIRMAPW